MQDIVRLLTNLTQVSKLLKKPTGQGDDSKTGTIAKLVLGMILYGIMPFDLIPDFIPVIGELDDAVVITLLLAVIGYLYLRARAENETVNDAPPQSTKKLLGKK